MLDLIYCAGSNERLMRSAYEAGWLLGVRSDRASYAFPLSFVDVHYIAPDFPRHLARVAGQLRGDDDGEPDSLPVHHWRRQHGSPAVLPDMGGMDPPLGATSR